VTDVVARPLPTVEGLARLIHLSPATIRANITRRPETLPPRVPGLTKPLWDTETYESWGRGNAWGDRGSPSIEEQRDRLRWGEWKRFVTSSKPPASSSRTGINQASSWCVAQVTDDPEDPPPELLDIWQELDASRRVFLLRLARALAEAAREEAAGERIIEQDGGGWGLG
jgi:hypothetical protein